MRAILLMIGVLWATLTAAFGQELSALARLDAAQSSITAGEDGVSVTLAISGK